MDPTNLGSDQKSENSSTLSLQFKVKNKVKHFLIHPIREPKERGFQNTHYFSQCDNFSKFCGCPKLGFFKKINQSVQYFV